ncbi:MAG: helix-turn-helix domain-containing protein [Acidimicrobiia bacterium]
MPGQRRSQVGGEVPGRSQPTETFEQHVGRAIRTLRRTRGMTMQQLADEAGLSQPFLSQVERALARPSIRSLDQIAKALNTSVMGLLGEPSDDRSVQVTRADDGAVTFSDPGAEGQLRSLVRGSHGLHAVEVTAVRSVPTDYLPLRSDQLVFVIEGRMQITVNDETMELEAADSIFVPRGLAYSWLSLGRRPLRFLSIALDPGTLEAGVNASQLNTVPDQRG